MKVSTKIIIICSILLGIFTFLCICPTNNVKAITQYQAAQAIADFALNVAKNHAAETHYVSPDSYHRYNAYKGIKTYKVNGKMVFGFDCNGFVSFVVHNSLGIGGKSFTKFAYPSGSKWVPNGGYFKQVSSGLSLSSALRIAQVGDLICSNGDGNTHIQIYVGNGEIVDCAGSYPEAVQIRGKNRKRDIRHSGGRFTVLRITEETAAGIDKSDVKIWLNQIGVVKPDDKAYYDQNGDAIIKNPDGTYQYADGRKIIYKDGKYVDENGNIVEINSSSIVVDEITGEVIGIAKDVLEEEQFQGILKIQRTASEQEEPRTLKYMKREELEQKAEANDITVLDYYSLNGEALVVPKLEELTLNTNGQAGAPTVNIELISIEYRTIVAKYSMPFEFQLALQTVSQNPEFVVELGNFQREGEIVLILQDYTVIDKTTYQTDTTTTVQMKGNEENPEITTSHYEEEIIIKTVTPVLNIKSADTWIYKVENNYTSSQSTETGELQENSTTNNFTSQSEEGEMLVTQDTVTKTQNIVEKTVWNQGTSNKESKEDLILPLFYEIYDIPNEDTDQAAGGSLRSGAQVLFALLESSEKTQEHARIMRYLIYKYNLGIDSRNYGVLDLDLDSIEEKFYTLEDNTTYDTTYDTTSYTSFVDDEGSVEGRSVAKVAEYFIRTGNAKNLLIYSQGSDRNKGFKLELASGKTKDRVQQIKYKDKLVYDCSSFVSTMYNIVFGIPTNVWSTDKFDSYKKEEIDGSKPYFYCVGTYDEVKDQIQPGDILIADKNSGNKYDHAMIYIGSGRIAHASSSNDLEIANIWSSISYVLRLKPNAVESINMNVTWPDGLTETVSLTNKGSIPSGTGGTSSGGNPTESPTNNNAYLTMDETELLERVVAAEARGEPFEGQVAVAAVALNRLEVKHGGKTTLRDILLAPEQFAAPYNGEISQSVKQAVKSALAGQDPTTTSLMPKGALYFNAMSRPASWYIERSGNKVKVIGNHVFYREFKPWNN